VLEPRHRYKILSLFLSLSLSLSLSLFLSALQKSDLKATSESGEMTKSLFLLRGASVDDNAAKGGRMRRRRRNAKVVVRMNEEKQKRNPFPLSNFGSGCASNNNENGEDDDEDDENDNNNNNDVGKPRIPIGGRFLWSNEGKSIGTGLKKLPDFRRNMLEEGTEDVWLKEMEMKHSILDAYGERCVVYKEEERTDLDEACRELLNAVAELLTEQYPERYAITEKNEDGSRMISIPKLDNYTASLEPKSGKEALITAARLSTNEFCIMRRSRNGGEEAQSEKQENGGDFFAREPSEHEFVAGVVCFSFDPKKREGKNLSQLHKPVPNYEEKIEMATRRVFDNLLRKMDEDGGQPLFRANWAIQNSSDLISTDLDWHPTNVKIGGVMNRKHLVEESSTNSFGDIDAMHTGYMDPTQGMPKNVREVGSKMFTRVEYETISKLKTNGFSLFTVKTYLEPLENFSAPEAAESLFVAITEASESELKYKSLENANLKNLILEYLVANLPKVQSSSSSSSSSSLSSTTVSSNVLKCPMGFSTPKIKEEREEDARTTQPHDFTPWTSFDKAIEDASPIPPSYYTSEKLAQRERATVFSPEKDWVCIGHVSDAPSVNDYFTTTVFSDESENAAAAAVEIVCVRTEENTFKAYENVCQHHFAKVADKKRGTCTAKANSCAAALQCPYHGFTYDVSNEGNGKLISATRMKGMEERTEKIKLKGGYVCETFGPFVFLKKDESSSSSSSSSLRTFLGADFASRVEEADINVSDRESFRHVARETFEVESNWKVFIDNYLDGGFHVPFAHKALVKEGCDMSKYNITLFDNMNSIQSVDVRKEENTNSRLGLGSATYAFAFPNVCLNRYGRWLDTNVAFPNPADPNKCVVEFNWYIDNTNHDEDDDEELFIKQSLLASRVVQDEDENLCASVQKGLRSKVASSSSSSSSRSGSGGDEDREEGLYSPECESIMFAFHKRYYRAVLLPGE